jgi:Spy/CpxP family protein refolding chaperone
LQYTEDQKAKIEKIRQDMRTRRDAVVKDDKLSPEQKDAFFQGFERMERSQIYEVLTPEQKSEVSKRMQARRQEGRKELKEKKPQQP